MIAVSGLSVSFGGAPVVSDVTFEIAPGEVLAIVGQSGSGKSVTARSLIGLSGGDVSAAQLSIDGVDVLTASPRRLRVLRGPTVGYVSQGALVTLDPLRLVGREVGDALRLHTALPAAARSARVVELLASAGVPEPALRASQRADELSGGLRQRALIASAIALSPSLIIADEPTTALDSTVAAGILTLLERLRDEGSAILLISHDLATVSRLASRIAVMHEGRIVEAGPAASVLGDPRHPYTRSLIAAVPTGVPRHAQLSTLPHGNSGVSSRPAAGAAAAARSPEVTPEFPTGTSARVVLEGRGLRKAFGARIAVDDVSFALEHGRTLGVVGESGSGKTTLARIALGLERADAGTTEAHGHRVSAIYQDALSSFDPRWRVGRILGPRAAELLTLVGLDPALTTARPSILSGGQQQRVGIARALARDPEIIVCDEPVSSLDTSAQALVLDLLDDLQQRLGLSYLFISHDLGVVRHMSDEVLVMRDGRVLESGPTEDVFANPQHEYTRALIAAAPTLP